MKESICIMLKSYPFEDSLEIQIAAHLLCQAIQCSFSVFLPVTKMRSAREFVAHSIAKSFACRAGNRLTGSF